jgi:uncharacterized membrane protein
VETHKRTFLRAITWRIVATLVTAAFTGLSGAIIINVVMTLAHYVHECIWLKINWGRK